MLSEPLDSLSNDNVYYSHVRTYNYTILEYLNGVTKTV